MRACGYAATIDLMTGEREVLIGSLETNKKRGDSSPASAPILVLTPVTALPNSYKSDPNIGLIVGSVAGALVLVSITLALVCFCLLRAKKFSSKRSDTGSSDPSVQSWIKGSESPQAGVSHLVDQKARVFTLAELELATKQWSPNNLIGEGSFGLVFKGLLEDGTIVAIKRRSSPASQEFAEEVDLLSHVQHRHLVILQGYCQENGEQMLVYDYLPNGSVNSHLYDADGNSLGKLDFKQRLSIALGAARGLEHLHSLLPPFSHKDFKTSNVLVDENFVPKVTDYGLLRLAIFDLEMPSSSNSAKIGIFLDPEYSTLQRLNEKSDVYSFGVFLLELISGQEAFSNKRSQSEYSIVEWAHALLERRDLGALVDDTLGGDFTEEGIKSIMELAFLCIEYVGDKRPTMGEIVKELDQILERERGFTIGIIDGTATVTLGSELFA